MVLQEDGVGVTGKKLAAAALAEAAVRTWRRLERPLNVTH
jgi:hypothetical protein